MRPLLTDQRATLGVLDRDECLLLLKWEAIGRLAVQQDDGAPIVVPLNFVLLDGDRVCFRLDPGATARQAMAKPVSFQVDRFDWYRRIGWSVLVQGTAQLLTDEEGEALEVGPEPWAPGERPLLVRITPDQITGRRIELADSPLDGRAYR
jgi:nitroimidazol reductase NimA-like FMN-containing flavoprotein (pyridoxamine 5'-phosphate oxidase superfamily)